MSSFDWRVVYQLALLETDPTKMQERIVDAQIAILKKGYKLLANPWCRELQELNDALGHLRLLENESSAERYATQTNIAATTFCKEK